jgi:peptidylprolyl isomerase
MGMTSGVLLSFTDLLPIDSLSCEGFQAAEDNITEDKVSPFIDCDRNTQTHKKEESMKNAKKGDTVKVHFTGRLDDGTEFATSRSDTPVEFTIGEGKLIPGIEDGTVGMAEGDQKTLHLEPNQAFGEKRPELVSKIRRSDIPDDIQPTVGLQLQMRSSSGNLIRVVVTEISEDEVTVDANHALAGQPLNFDIELVEFV